MKAASALAVVSCLVLALLVLPGANSQAPQDEAQPEPQPASAGGEAVECRWAIGRIELDGVIDERAWDKAETVELRVPWENRKSATATKARLLWDGDFLYFCAEMQDHDLYADVMEANGRVTDNDAFGLFIKPSETKLNYHEFMVNAGSTPLEIAFPSRGGGGARRFAPQSQLNFEGMVKLNGTLNNWTDQDKGWTLEARIPWSTFKLTGGRPKIGERWRFAFCRYDYSVTLERPELSTNAPLTRPDLHRYEEYQDVVFVQRK